jgi:predicted RNA-binding protein YlxR (DUF448 family)
MARKHIPQRTCITCRRVKGKREMVRVVRTSGGEIQIDPSGKLAGRGAYLCRERECWEDLLANSGKLEHGLNLTRAPSEAEVARLKEYGASLPLRAVPAPAEDRGAKASRHEARATTD